MRSHFSAQTLAEIFRDLYLTEQTGVLVLNREDIEKRVYFDRGIILYAESPVDSERLGACLVQAGQLSTGALAEAKSSLNGSTSTTDLARALVQRELIGRAAVRRTVLGIIDRVVESVFRWEGGGARFSEGRQESTVLESDILSTVGTILRGIFCMAGFSAIHGAMKALDNRLRIRTPEPFPMRRLPLSPAHGFILSRVDGNTSLNDVISILPQDEEETASRFLFGLLLLGVLEYDPPLGGSPFKVGDLLRDHADRRALERMQELTIQQAYAQLRTQNPHDMLGVEPSATHAEIERAYERTKAQFGRERLLPKVREQFRSELALIERRLIEAYLTLTKLDTQQARGARPVSPEIEVKDLNVRVEMDKAKSKVALEESNRVADAYYSKALQAAREGDFHNAIQYGKLAISHNGSDARYFNLIAECQERNPEARWQRLAEENYNKATQLDPWNAAYWIRLGRLYKKRGLKIRARKKFEEALKLVPNHPEIQAEIKEMD